MIDILNEIKKYSDKFDRELLNYFRDDAKVVPILTDAQKYGIMSGGKRIRPFLTLEFCRLFGGDEKSAMPFA